MIGFIKGKFLHKSPTQVLVDCNGLGYELEISLNTFSKIKDLGEAGLNTYLHVREDALVLFGFYDIEEKDLFMHLISVNGIGSTTARGILSYSNPDELKHAIVNGEVHTIQKIKGIGAKTAQRLILELKDKLIKSGSMSSEEISKSDNKTSKEALLALTSLGLPKAQAQLRIDRILKIEGDDISLEALVKKALKS